MQKCLPGIRQLSEFYTFQQESVPPYSTQDCSSVDEVDSKLHSPSSPVLNSVDYKVWSEMQEVYKRRVKDVD